MPEFVTEDAIDAKAVLARETMRTDPHARTFLVSDHLLEDPAWTNEWSAPVQFRFEMSDGGVLDLVFRTV